MATRQDPTFGLAVFDTRISPDTLAATGSGVLESAYAEAGPIPGHPVPSDTGSRWRPQITDAQSVGLTVRSSVGGYPGRSGAAVLYRKASESNSTDWRGWNEPNLITDWTAPTDGWGGSEVYDTFAAAVITESQLIIVTALDQGTGAAITWSYNPRTGTWTNLYDWDSGSRPGLVQPIGMAYDEEKGRLLIWSGANPDSSTGQNAYYSDDGGSTWSLYARGFLAEHPDDVTSFTSGMYRVAIPPGGGDWLMFILDDDDGTGQAIQYASSDRGVTWDKIDACASTRLAHYPVWGPAGFAVIARETTNNSLQCRILPTARSLFDDAADVDMEPTSSHTEASTNHTAVCDYDGMIYVHSLVTGGTLKEGCVFRSADGGTTWNFYIYRLFDCGDSVNYPEWQVAVPSCGAVHLIGTIIGSTNTDGTVSLTSCGGWDDVCMGAYQPSTGGGFRRQSYGEAATAGDADTVRTWLPWAVPQNIGWTATTNTGTTSSTAEPGLTLTTSGGTAQIYTSTDVSAKTNTAVEICVKMTSGSALASLNSTNIGAYCQINLADNGSYHYQVFLHIGTDGVRLDDPNASTLGTGTVDTTAAFVRVRIHATKGKVWAWYKSGYGTEWTRFVNGATVTDQGATAFLDYVQWGNGASEDATSVWRFVGWSQYGGYLYGAPSIDESGESVATTSLGHMFGKTLPPRGGAAGLSGYPIPDATSTSEDVGRISAVGGPTYLGESVSLPADHTYSTDHIHPDESPSPRRPWRHTGTTETRFVYDQGSGSESWYGGALVLAALKCDFRTCALATDDGAGGITTIATLDKGWGSINYTRSGEMIVPRTGTATISRYFAEDELVGGYVVMNTAGSDVARRIARQSAGYWTTDATVQRMRIHLDGVDGTETASGSGSIVHHSGVLVAYPAAETARRYVRLLIAASQTVPDSYYTAGVLSVGRVFALGQEPDWGWRAPVQLSRTTRRAADGSLSVREVGPPRRVMSYGWSQVNMRSIRTLSGAESYTGISGGFALGSGSDPAPVVTGLLEHKLRSGEVPVVVLPRIPTSSTTITDPTLYLYGRLASEGLSIGGAYGTEGTDEVISFTGLTVEELR